MKESSVVVAYVTVRACGAIYMRSGLLLRPRRGSMLLSVSEPSVSPERPGPTPTLARFLSRQTGPQMLSVRPMYSRARALTAEKLLDERLRVRLTAKEVLCTKTSPRQTHIHNTLEIHLPQRTLSESISSRLPPGRRISSR